MVLPIDPSHAQSVDLGQQMVPGVPDILKGLFRPHAVDLEFDVVGNDPQGSTPRNQTTIPVEDRHDFGHGVRSIHLDLLQQSPICEPRTFACDKNRESFSFE